MEMTPQYETILMNDVWVNSDEFIDDYDNIGISKTISDESATTLFYILWSRHANDPIANRDVHQWKMKFFAKIFQFGPTWEKRLEIQKKIRELTDDELVEGTKATHNSAMNPQTAPGTGTNEELGYIDSQNVSKYKKPKLEAYDMQWSLLATDVTEDIISRFSDLFLKVVKPQKPLLYITEEEDYGY